MEHKDLFAQLESLIDYYGTPNVIETLAQVCYAKEAHVRENWQDKDLAKLWARNAKIIINAYAKVYKPLGKICAR